MKILKFCKKLLITSCLFAFLLIPQQVDAQNPQISSAQREILLQQIDLLLEQILILQAQLDQLQASEDVESGKITQTVYVYDIYKADNITNSIHQPYFKKMFDILPDEYDEQISHVLVYGGDASFDAYVETVPPKHNSWLYGAHVDVVLEREPDVELILHELAHIISYEELIGVPKPAVTECHVYFTDNGCPVNSSYLGQFVNEFWQDGDLDRVTGYSNWENQLEAGYQYYDLHENDFVSDYAAVSPEEDFAESLVFFLLEDTSGTHTKADEKIEFFEQFTKMQELKQTVGS